MQSNGYFMAIPSYLIILIVVLVIVPSVIAVLLRMALHYYLIDQGNQVIRLINGQPLRKPPKIVNYLETRLAEASQQLEQVNTPAIIDQVYSQQRVLLISCEQIEQLGRILPNLLLSFGLLGTFIGITINLYSLSETVSTTNVTDISSLLQDIQTPLQGMGIAFTTSLAAILFSALLVVINFMFNTNLAKYRWMSALEDYLDNIYQPTLKGQTKTDKIVQEMVQVFDQFLIRFGQGIQTSIETAFRQKIDEIYATNLKANQLAEQVYSRLIDASVTVTQSAKDFQIAGDRFLEVARAFEQSEFPQQLSNATINLANTQRGFSQSASGLATSVQSVDLAVIELQNYSKRLIKFSEQIQQTNQTALNLLETQNQNQQSFNHIVEQVQTASQGFQLAVNNLDSLQRRMVNKTDNLEEIQAELSKLVVAMQTYSQGVNTAVGGGVAANYPGNSINSMELQPVISGLQECVSHLQDTKNELYRLRHTIEKQ
ncbi:hypothetical protein AAEJ74_01735 [Limnospira fusiformis PMC 851.14]|uniref:MotA/TolQ/ExbB proton channel domain-containing protein n=1 Tax=Limnospira fusiformis PMC 851.14 TaxID=2219512 RepID=A0ABU9EEU4_LIMFS